MGFVPKDTLDLGFQQTACTNQTNYLNTQAFLRYGILSVSDGVLTSSVGDVNCNGKLLRWTQKPNVVEFTHSSSGDVEFKVGTAGEYGQIHRGQQVIKLGTDPQSCSTSTTLTPTTDSSPQPVTTGCGAYVKSKLLPNGFTLCWSRKKGETQIQLSHALTTAQWIAFGVGKANCGEQCMEGANVIFGYSDSAPATRTISNDGKANPNGWRNTHSNPLNFQSMTFEITSGQGSLSFHVGNDKLPDEANIIVGVGPYLSNTFNQHISDYKQIQINFLTGAVEIQSLPVGLIFHAIFMALGWGVLLPGGMLIARFGKTRFPEGQWFAIHKKMQIAGLFLAFIGIILAFSYGSGTKYAHMSIGIIVMILGFSQPLNAFFRPHPPKDEPKSQARIYWEYLHKGSGYMSIFLGLVNICVGIYVVTRR